jgi:hypothetical protein
VGGGGCRRLDKGKRRPSPDDRSGLISLAQDRSSRAERLGAAPREGDIGGFSITDFGTSVGRPDDLRSRKGGADAP